MEASSFLKRLEFSNQPAMNTFHLHLHGRHWALSEHAASSPVAMYWDAPKADAFELACSYLDGSGSYLKIHGRNGEKPETRMFPRVAQRGQLEARARV